VLLAESPKFGTIVCSVLLNIERIAGNTEIPPAPSWLDIAIRSTGAQFAIKICSSGGYR
jgi:hypothetical protein